MARQYEVKDSDIQIFRQWLKHQTFLPQHENDQFITYVLAASNGSIERAKEKYDKYFEFQCRHPEIYRDFDLFAENTRRNEIHKILRIFPLPRKTPDGCTLFLTSLITSEVFDYDDYLFGIYSVVQSMLWGDTFGDCKFIFISDCKGLTAAHAKNLTPSYAVKLAAYLKAAIPRIAQVYIINLPPILEWAMNLILKFLSPTLRERTEVHTNVESLFKRIPKEMMPEEYGGDEVSQDVLNERMLENLHALRERFKEQKQLRDSEAKLRPKTDNTDIMDGTFKKLEID